MKIVCPIHEKSPFIFVRILSIDKGFALFTKTLLAVERFHILVRYHRGRKMRNAKCVMVEGAHNVRSAPIPLFI